MCCGCVLVLGVPLFCRNYCSPKRAFSSTDFQRTQAQYCPTLLGSAFVGLFPQVHQWYLSAQGTFAERFTLCFTQTCSIGFRSQGAWWPLHHLHVVLSRPTQDILCFMRWSIVLQKMDVREDLLHPPWHRKDALLEKFAADAVIE